MSETTPARSAEAPEFFCANPVCMLHVCRTDACVRGNGEWAVRPDGICTSRSVYGGRVLCDLCGRAWAEGLLRLPP